MRRKNYLQRSNDRLYYSLAELVKLTGLSRSRIYSLERMGFIRPAVYNGRRLYDHHTLRKLMDFKVLARDYPPQVIVSSYEKLKVEAQVKRCKGELIKLRNRIRRFLRKHGKDT
ncbi:MAG: MerR family transcriptional regulator [Thermotogae bacterium]|nr:MerR family transcriptional regulator [Thermotogota bacterium]